MRYVRSLGPVLSLFLVGTATSAHAQSNFSFDMPWNDASVNVTNLASLNPAPIDSTRKVSARNGRFYDGTGRRVRFLGVNLTFSANFPDHATSDAVAARLHRFGVNAVRLHNMDSSEAPRGIFKVGVADKSQFDPDQLDRLDYLVSKLKANGVYVDLNLHVGRELSAGDGLSNTSQLPDQGKILAYYEPNMLAIQQNYVRNLLNHVNPYTSLRWGADPVIGMIELNNEDSLVTAGWGSTLQNLPEYYKAPLRQRWNSYLLSKYGNTTNMVAAWNQTPGANILTNGAFTSGSTGWILDNQAGAASHLVVNDITGLPVSKALRIAVDTNGTENWHVQLHQTGRNLVDGQAYNVQFWARTSSGTKTISVNAKGDQSPYAAVGLNQALTINTTWQRFNFNFIADQPVANHTRLTFAVGQTLADCWLADVVLRPGVVYSLPAGQSLETGNVDLPQASPLPQGQDYVDFLMGVESDYASTMTSYIRGTLGCYAPITCSQSNFGGLSGLARESNMDFVDAHAYWDHPTFPGTPWSPTDWVITNQSMVKDANAGTLARLAMHRVNGKPFTVTEYNHVAPNEYQAETLPMLAAYAAWQDWNGIFLYGYSGDRALLTQNGVKGYFDVDTNPAKAAFLPAAANLFLRGDLTVATTGEMALTVPRSQLVSLTAAYNSQSNIWDSLGFRAMPNLWNDAGSTPNALISGLSSVKISDTATAVSLALPTGTPGGSNFMKWTLSPAANPALTVTSSKSLTLCGFPATGTATTVGDLTVTPGALPRGFISLMLTSMDNLSCRDSASLLLTVAGNVANSGMVWNAAHTSVNNNWGTGPATAEPIPAAIKLRTTATSATVYALSPTGSRVGTVSSTLSGGYLTFQAGNNSTLWYEITASRTAGMASSIQVF